MTINFLFFENYETLDIEENAVLVIPGGQGTRVFVNDELDNWVRPGLGHLYYAFDSIKDSAQKIKDLGQRTTYYGHGKPTEDI